MSSEQLGSTKGRKEDGGWWSEDKMGKHCGKSQVT